MPRIARRRSPAFTKHEPDLETSTSLLQSRDSAVISSSSTTKTRSEGESLGGCMFPCLLPMRFIRIGSHVRRRSRTRDKGWGNRFPWGGFLLRENFSRARIILAKNGSYRRQNPEGRRGGVKATTDSMPAQTLSRQSLMETPKRKDIAVRHEGAGTTLPKEPHKEIFSASVESRTRR